LSRRLLRWRQNAVNVHEATASFTAVVDRYLVNAPNIGINADGSEAIAFGYMNAAGIPRRRRWGGRRRDHNA
jgi:hypothetical protein